MIYCTDCDNDRQWYRSIVTESRVMPEKNTIRRRRKCLNCNAVWWTIETTERVTDPVIVLDKLDDDD